MVLMFENLIAQAIQRDLAPRNAACRQVRNVKNTYLLFDSSISARNGDILYVRYKEEKLIRFYEEHGNNITLYAATPGYPAIHVDSRLEILGVVTWSFNKHRN